MRKLAFALLLALAPAPASAQVVPVRYDLTLAADAIMRRPRESLLFREAGGCPLWVQAELDGDQPYRVRYSTLHRLGVRK